MNRDTTNIASFAASSPTTTRRDFLTGTGTALLGLAAAGLASSLPARADDLEGPTAARPLVGSGENTYECVHGWLNPPPDLLWGDTQGVAQDEQGRIYITHTVHPKSPSPNAIAVFDRDGNYLTSWGERFRGGGHGLDIRKEDGVEYLYHCDTNHKLVVKTTLDGTVVWEKGLPTEAGVYDDKHKFVPTNVTFAPNGDFYVADGYGSSYVHQYDIKGNYTRTWGGRGTEPGKMNVPHGIWLDTRAGIGTAGEPLLVVADRENSRLQYFTLDGKFVRQNKDGMRRPCHFDIRGDLLLVPDLTCVVTLLDKDNKVVAALGDGVVNGKPSPLRGHGRGEFIPGRFVTPHGAKFLQNGDILVVEWLPIGRITLLKKVAA